MMAPLTGKVRPPGIRALHDSAAPSIPLRRYRGAAAGMILYIWLRPAAGVQPVSAVRFPERLVPTLDRALGRCAPGCHITRTCSCRWRKRGAAAQDMQQRDRAAAPHAPAAKVQLVMPTGSIFSERLD